jgi:mRNA interferase HicA
MSRLPSLRPRQVIQALERGGFVLRRVKGSHHFFTHPGKPGALVIVPVHGRDIKRGVLHSILKQAHLTSEELLELL